MKSERLGDSNQTALLLANPKALLCPYHWLVSDTGMTVPSPRLKLNSVNRMCNKLWYRRPVEAKIMS